MMIHPQTDTDLGSPSRHPWPGKSDNGRYRRGVALRITHVSFSRSGGAGAVASRLAAAQRKAGLESRFAHLVDTDLRNEPLRRPRHTIAALWDQQVVKNPGFPAMVSLARDQIVSPPSLDEDTDIVHLHWINGVGRMEEVSLDPHRPVVWTLHDMNPFTGACHYALDCTNYTTDCQSCPAVRPRFQPKVTKNLLDKRRSLTTGAPLAIVCPSRWLAGAAKSSAMFRDHTIHVIPNPVDERFFLTPHAPIAQTDDVVGIVVAQDLDDPTKNVQQAVDAFRLHRLSTGEGTLVLVGRGGQAFTTVPGVILTGRLDIDGLISWFDRADYLIVSSQAENAPMVAFEAASRGCWPLVAGHTGLAEIPETLRAGALFGSTDELVSLIAGRHLVDHTTRMNQRERVVSAVGELCHPSRVERQYRDIYNQLLDARNTTSPQ